MIMEFLVFVVAFVELGYVSAEIGSGALMNKLIKVKPVGAAIARNFVPLTEIPPPAVPPSQDGRRHLDHDCVRKPDPQEVHEGGNVNIFGEYYDDRIAKTVATVIIPDHIDYKHFQVTTQVPYLTVGPIEAIGYHPSTLKPPSECEKIYQDHMAEQYSDETTDYSEESLEMARMPLNYDAGMEGEQRDSMSMPEFRHESVKSIRPNKRELDRLLKQHLMD